MWDNFLGAQTRGEMCDCICPSRLGQRIKKQQLTRRGGRQRGWRSEREGWGRREHLWGYDSLEGKCCLPTCLQGCQLYDTHTQMCTCIWVVIHAKMSTHRHINRQTRVHEGRFTKCNKGLIDHVLEVLQYIKIDACICPTLTVMPWTGRRLILVDIVSCVFREVKQCSKYAVISDTLYWNQLMQLLLLVKLQFQTVLNVLSFEGKQVRRVQNGGS